MVTTWRRQRISTKPRTERIYINCGIIFNHGKYCSLRNSCRLLYIALASIGLYTFPLFVCLSAESQPNLQTVWSTLKLKELPSFVRVADLKAINFTTGICTHESCINLQPLEEFVARMRFLDVHWVPILRKSLKLNTITRCLTMRAYPSTHLTMSFPMNNFWSLSFDINLLICQVYILNNICYLYELRLCDRVVHCSRV